MLECPELTETDADQASVSCAIVPFEVIRRARNCFITEMHGKPVEILHYLLNVGPEVTREVLDFAEHHLETTKTCLVGRRGEDALVFTPDDCAA